MRPASSWFDFVRLLLGVANRRARGRSRAAAKRRNTGATGAIFGFAILGGIVFQTIGGIVFWFASVEADHAFLRSEDASLQAFRFPVSESAWQAIRAADAASPTGRRAIDPTLTATLTTEAQSQLGHSTHGQAEVVTQELLDRFRSVGVAGFVSSQKMQRLGDAGFCALTGLCLIWWLALVLQGEGVNFDMQRRRHPMWEWYFEFPIPSSAVFAAEALSPIASNPYMLTAPCAIGAIAGMLHASFLVGVLGTLLSIPLVISAAMWAKAIEVLVMLRISPRNRSAWFALAATLGFIAMFLPFVMMQSHDTAMASRIVTFASPVIAHLPSARILFDFDDPLSFFRAMIASVVIGTVIALPAVAIMNWATRRGLDSGFGGSSASPRQTVVKETSSPQKGWWRDPLIRKELLWLRRDRGAIVQLFVVPFALIGVQFFNLRHFLMSADLNWHRIAGLILGFGTYMLFILGPRALVGEGPALGYMLTWPRSLEDTLRAKVHTLFALVTAIVVICLIGTAWFFPEGILGLFLVALTWLIYGLAVTEKAVTLIRAPSQGGEAEPIPASQQWSASLGNFALAIALFVGQWQLAFIAVVINWVFAASLWQRFRLRLEYLFDPESEPELTPPTVLSSLLAIVGMMELATLLSAVFVAALGKDASGFALTFSYTIAASIVCIAVIFWHQGKGVSLLDILRPGEAPAFSWAPMLSAVGIGVCLGVVGSLYSWGVNHIDWTPLHDTMERSRQILRDHPSLALGYSVTAIAVAPWAEEFLFRGLMFRAMVPMWGLPRAVVASSAFFTVLHPWPAWPIVFVLGSVSALLFARTQSLVPSIILHFTYNTIVLMVPFA